MNTNKKRKIGFSIICTFLITLILPTLPVAQVTNPTNLREETVISSGYWKRVQWGGNPWDPNPVFGYALMFEPLFGMNTVDNEIIPVIGTSYTWNADGSKLIISLNPNAKFSNGESITATDVIASYETAANQYKYKSDFTKIVDSFLIIDTNTIRIDLKPSFNYSRKIIELITTDIPILDKDVLDLVKADLYVSGEYDYMNGDLSLWQPNFYDPAYNSAYKVYSGPYEPYYLNTDGTDERLRLRDDWWGFGNIYQDLPNAPTSSIDGIPKYISNQIFNTNELRNEALLAGNIDLHSTYFENVVSALQTNEYINTYYERNLNKPYFLGLGPVISLVPNQIKYPFNEKWIRDVFAYSINYDIYPDYCLEGDWTRASQGFLSPDSPSHTNEYDPAIDAQYQISYDPTMATKILEKHCKWNGAYWFTRTNQSDGGGTLIGNYEIINVLGWTDINAATDLLANDLYSIGIPTVRVDVSQADWVILVNDRNFDLALQNQGPDLLKSSLKVLDGLRGEHLHNKNASSWQNSSYNDLYKQFEVTANDPVKTASIVSQMQEILAKEKPEIPICNNAFWYLYSTQYWKGWLNVNNLYNQQATVYTVDTMAVKARLYLNLRPSNSPDPTPTIPVPPNIDSPTDIDYQMGDIGNLITWSATDDNPTVYKITQNGLLVSTGSWSSGNPITVNVDDRPSGIYIYTCIVNDADDSSNSDSVILTVIGPPVIIDKPSDFEYLEGDTGNLITWIATDNNPTTYIITRNGQTIDSGSWSKGSQININVDDLTEGTYTFTCTVYDGDEQTDSNSVIVTVYTFHNGDVNHDGDVNIIDALLTAYYYVALDPQPFYPEEADVNRDGSIDIVDAMLIAQAYVGLIDLPP